MQRMQLSKPKELGDAEQMAAIIKEQCPYCGGELYHNGTFPEDDMTRIETTFECAECEYAVELEVKNPSWIIKDSRR